ncbi:PIN/TRAM domain-containing protein [Schlesneria paludicola]|uniref:PIN/TRAM domain-containing protein n=1 Tax=Schlesneria paludicola TaxID=360056 RepID=UPI00029A1DF7|nr:PIN domain-containing protein [Schlesneria paludicola]
MLIFLRVVYVLICAGAAVALVQNPAAPAFINSNQGVFFVLILLMTQIVTLIDIVFPRKRLDVITAIYFGLLVGWLLAFQLQYAAQAFMTSVGVGTEKGVDGKIENPVARVIGGIAGIMLPYICISFLLQTKDDFRFVIPYVEFAKEIKGGRPLVIDTSALIDGRIADVMDTNIFDTELIVPSFVLEELQNIADSQDKNRRTRGRRGLDVLTKLQQKPKVEVRMLEVREKDDLAHSVDQRIVALAKRMSGRVVTNDFNLNKVASVQGVEVINLNDVANALKPRYLPGEQLHIKVMREGESFGQGVGYLDDGTMVVCEQASTLIGKEIDVVVTSMLQNSAGRMIFGRLLNSPVSATR